MADEVGPGPIGERYPWVRRADESSKAYSAFQSYLNMGLLRKLAAVADNQSVPYSTVCGWSARYRWVDRSLAFDQWTATQATEALGDDLKGIRSQQMELSQRLLEHLATRLDHFIETRQDPTIRWTQAFMAAAKVQSNAALYLKDSAGGGDAVKRVMDKVEKALQWAED